MRKLLRRLSALLHRRRLERELAEDMAVHREMMPPERRAHFGSTLRFQEQAADYWGWTWLDDLRQDVAYATRQLRRSPGFTLTAIAVLSLGIGVNLAEVHVFNAFLHRMDLVGADTLGQFVSVSRQGVRSTFALPEIEFYRRNSTAFSALIAETRATDIRHAEDSVTLRGGLVTGNYFSTLGIRPLYGRMIEDQDDKPGAPRVAVLAYDYWQSRFAGEPAIVGRTIRLNEQPVQVIGITPAEFGGIGWHADLWMALSQFSLLTGSAEATLSDSRTRPISLFGRLKYGVSFAAAQEQLRPLIAALRRQQPQYVEPGEWLKIDSMKPSAPTEPAAILMLTTFILLVLLVLLSACANLGNMLLARGLARRREIEIRLAIGASRSRLIRQLMTENLLLAALASAAALFVGRLAAMLLWRITGAPSAIRIVTDWRIVLACAALGLVATLAFGLAPALQSVRGGPSATRARKILVSVQVAASCVLLILSSFFSRAIQRGFDAAVTFDYAGLAFVDPNFYQRHAPSAEARQTAADMAVRLRQLPRVEGASVAAFPSILRARRSRVLGKVIVSSEVDPSYFATLRLPLLTGRIFGPADPDAMVISESAARQLWPNQSPLGKTLRLGQQDRTVIGIVKDSGMNLIIDPESVEVYLPLSEEYAAFASILVRTANPAATMPATLQSASTISGIHPLVYTAQSLIDLRFDSIRKMLRVFGSLGAVASLLALIGIFGLLALTVAQRTREIGVRMALGARARDILRVVLGQYLLPFGTGSAVGVALAAAAAAIFRSTVYGFIHFDVLSFGGGLLLFAAVAMAASIAPARRALRVDPSSALRYE